MQIQRCMSLLVSLALLSWADLMQDGNLLWEIALTEVERARKPLLDESINAIS